MATAAAITLREADPARKLLKERPFASNHTHRLDLAEIGRWSAEEIVDLLKSGSLPDGDVVGAAMADVVEHNSSHWTDDDRKAVVEYIRSLPKRKTP